MLSSSDLKAVEEYLKNLSGVNLSYPHGKSVAVFSINDIAFAYLEGAKHTTRLSVRSDPRLAQLLKDKYEEVLSGQKLNPKIWITIVLSGQLTYAELTALIDHSYQLAQQAT